MALKCFLSLLTVGAAWATDWVVTWRPDIKNGINPIVASSLRLTIGRDFYLQGKIYADVKADEVSKIKISAVFQF